MYRQTDGGSYVIHRPKVRGRHFNPLVKEVPCITEFSLDRKLKRDQILMSFDTFIFKIHVFFSLSR